MKTDLSHLPQRKRRELARIVDVLFAEFEDALSLCTSKRKKKGRIQKIILFGSHARADWVEDVASGYMSDYDLLIIVSEHKLTDYEYWYKAEDQLMRGKNIWFTRDTYFKPEVNFIVHTLAEVNDHLAKGLYFYTDIRRDGIALYELKNNRKLGQPKPLNAQEAYEVAQEHFDIWYEKSAQMFMTYEFSLDKKWNNQAAFMLHQTTESIYKCLLLVLTNYTPDLHNIERLRSLCEDRDKRLVEVWPRYHRRHKRRFQLLKCAYVEARYSKHYKISKRELEWLGERVTHLQILCKSICKEHLTQLKTDIH